MLLRRRLTSLLLSICWNWMNDKRIDEQGACRDRHLQDPRQDGQQKWILVRIDNKNEIYDLSPQFWERELHKFTY